MNFIDQAQNSRTAGGVWLPSLHIDVAVVAAAFDICLHKLASKTINWRVLAKHFCAGANVGLWVNVSIASIKGSLLQNITPVLEEQGKIWGGKRSK